MSVAPDLQNTFFLTRQSANVMEDLYRQLNQAGVVCLLYGVRGVGKSRLLEQFISSRLVQDEVVHVEFDAKDTFHALATPEQQWGVEQFVQKLLQPSAPNSIFVIDHIEHAPPDIIAAIFHYWQLEARLKDQKLILTSNPDKLKQLLDLSQKSSVAINSLELKPLSSNEQLEFIRSRCCPGHAQQPVLNRQQRLQLKQSQGLFMQLVLLQKQWAGQIECRQQQQKRSMLVPASLVFGVIALGLLVWILSPVQTGEIKPLAEVQNDPVPLTPAETAVAAPAATDTQAETQQADSTEPGSKVALDRSSELAEQADADNTSPQPAAATDMTASPDGETIADEPITQSMPDPPLTRLNDEEQAQISPPADAQSAELRGTDDELSTEQGEASADPEPPQPSAESQAELATPVVVEPELSLYQQRLRASEQWLAQSADSTSSIQLMLLGFEIDAEQAIEQYLERLLANDIDTDNIMLYLTTKNQREVIGVLYGVYPDRRRARQNISGLPRALNANKPIIRTVKGIKDEITSDQLQR